jgi:hypothetical protein
MSELLYFVLFAMSALAPNRDHSELANAIASVVENEPPLFKNDESRLKTASVLVSVAFRESSFRNNAIGDKGHALCAFQLWHTSRDVLTNPERCVELALERLRTSMKVCGRANALGLYAAGPGGCQSLHARRITNDRFHIAKQLLPN